MSRISGLRVPAMTGRDPDEAHRPTTPLELLFDLCFVVAVSQAAAGLHHALGEGHYHDGLVGYTTVFFAIWWAWMNFTWLASAYDPDDVAYRLLALVQIAGVLVLASGVSAAFASNDFGAIVVGYLIMRLALCGLWLRAAAGDTLRRSVALRYAAGVAFMQALWVVRVFLPERWALPTFAALVVGELLVPLWAERAGPQTPWHPEHIAERYGAFTIIVLGECILSATAAIGSARTANGTPSELIVTAGGSLVLLFALWWLYFDHPADEGLRAHPQRSFLWGYGHYFVFASVAALGAGIAAATEAIEHPLPIGDVATAYLCAAPVAVFVMVSTLLHRHVHDTAITTVIPAVVASSAVLVVPLFAGATSIAATIVAMAAVVALLVVVVSLLDQGGRTGEL